MNHHTDAVAPPGPEPEASTMALYEIREADDGDCREIARVQVDGYRMAYAGSFPEPYLARFSYEEQEQDWIELISTTDDIVLVAVSPEEGVIGYVLARAKPDIYPGFDAEILALHVSRPFQRGGVGTALFGAAIERLEERGSRSVMLWTLRDNPVREWYQRLDGRVLGEQVYQVDAWDIVEIAYGWDPISTLVPGNRTGRHLTSPSQQARANGRRDDL